jgi:hypothetical protein
MANQPSKAGWWFGTFGFGLFFHILGMASHPNWRTPSLFSGEKPPSRLLLTIMKTIIITIHISHY